MRERGTGTITKDGYIEVKINGRSYLEHRLIATKALGKPLPPKARVHHVDENGLNNANDNLVICPDDAYHQLLHRRMIAIDETGDPSMTKCQYCKQWDRPENLVEGKRVRYHRTCKNDYEKRRTAA